MKIKSIAIVVCMSIIFWACTSPNNNNQPSKEIVESAPFHVVGGDTLLEDRPNHYSIVVSKKLFVETAKSPNLKLWLQSPNQSFFTIRVTQIPPEYLNQSRKDSFKNSGEMESRVIKENGGTVSEPKNTLINIDGRKVYQFSAVVRQNQILENQIHLYTAISFAENNDLYMIHCRQMKNDFFLSDSIRDRMISSIRILK